jgi:hypothetical protein
MAKKKTENTENIEMLDNEPKPTSYLISFDDDGKRLETYIANEYSDEAKAEMLAKGFIEISEADWRYYAGLEGTGDNGTGYVRGKDGKPISAPAYVPTKAEKIAQLENQYNTQKAEIKGYLMEAILSDDTDNISELKQEMADIEADYQAKREELEG